MLRVFFGFFGSPLTAHHSWVVGMSAARVNSSLEKDTLEHRLMMRLSVMAAGLLILQPALFTFSASPLTLVTLLTYPGLIIIQARRMSQSGALWRRRRCLPGLRSGP